MFEHIPYEHPLVIGTGGGNDIISASLVVADLHRRGVKADLAGICSPAARHSYNGLREQPVNKVSEHARRVIPAKDPKKISFIDALIPGLLKAEGIPASIYNLSCGFGTDALVHSLSSLIKTERYDGIIAVDVGGDILARPKDTTILSPLMDFTTLYVLGQLPTPSVLLEFGLQTDAELRPQGCAEILEELFATGMLKHTQDVDPEDDTFATYKRIFHGVSHIRKGNTIAALQKTLIAQNDITITHEGSVRVQDQVWKQNFSVVLESKYFRKAYTIDVKALAQSRPFALPYKSTLEQVLKTKMIADVRTECDALYTSINELVLRIGVLPPGMKYREHIIRYGTENLPSHADGALIWKKDLALIPHPRKELSEFALIGCKKDMEEAVMQIFSRL